MEKELTRLAGDKNTMESFQAFLTASIARQAAQWAFERKDTACIADAKELLEAAIVELFDTYGPREAQRENTNEAR